MTQQAITEDMNVHQQWFKDAQSVTLDTLAEFVHHVMNDYQHDYGTICHAVAACAVAASWAANAQPQGSVTGMQASFIMWDYIREWGRKEGPLTLKTWEQALYPQNEDRFAHTIHETTLKWLQEEARKKLAEPVKASPNVKAHWQMLAAGGIPFGLQVVRE